MSYLLVVGLHLISPEPETTIGPVIKAFRLEAVKARVDAPPQRGHGEAAAIWRNISRRGARWADLKGRFHRLRQLGPLPAFALRYPTVTIGVVEGAIELRSAEYAPLRKLKDLYEKEPRHPAYGSSDPVSLIELVQHLPPARKKKAGRQKSAARA